MNSTFARITLGTSLLILFLGLSAPAYATVLIDSNTGDTSAFTAQQNQDLFKAKPADSGPTPLTGGVTAAPASNATPLNGGVTAAPASNNAAGQQSGGNNVLVNPLKNISSLSGLLGAVLGAAVQLGTIILILAFVWIGFQFVRAQGKPAEIDKAKTALLWTCIGGLILLGAQALSSVIQSTVSSL
jgi:hypothetical protein